MYCYILCSGTSLCHICMQYLKKITSAIKMSRIRKALRLIDKAGKGVSIKCTKLLSDNIMIWHQHGKNNLLLRFLCMGFIWSSAAEILSKKSDKSMMVRLKV